jgi:A/G-specific adenine glycosylase
VGSYTAAAIASFVFKEKVAVVDGNVIRVLSRYFGIEVAFDTAAGRKQFVEKANALIDETQPDKFNQAIMDFGATVCKPKKPRCTACPFQKSCVAFRENRIDGLPFKSKRIKIKNRYFIAFLINTNEGFAIKKRTDKDIWKALFELPLVEVPSFEKRIAQQASELYEGFSENENYEFQELSETYNQKLSHQEIHVVFAQIKPLADLKLSKEYLYTRNLTKFAFPNIFILYFRSKSLILD